MMKFHWDMKFRRCYDRMSRKPTNFSRGSMSISIGFFFGYQFGTENAKEEFTKNGAMEVYKGNTTLEYKVVNNVRVDSCVIFNDKI